MIAGLAAAAWCVAMALASKLIPLCPCCGVEVRISRLVASLVWAALAGAFVVFPGRRRQLAGFAALLSVVQGANFWQQFRHDGMAPTSWATWTFAGAAAGAVLFGAAAVLMRRRAAAA